MKLNVHIGWGIVIYAIMYLSLNALAIYGLASGLLPRLIQLVVLVILTMIAGRALKFHSWKDILPYSVVWAITVGLLDLLLAVPFSGVAMYGDWNLWIGYLLVAALPLLAPQSRIIIHEDPVRMS